MNPDNHALGHWKDGPSETQAESKTGRLPTPAGPREKKGGGRPKSPTLKPSPDQGNELSPIVGSGKQPFDIADLERLGRIIRWIRKKRPGGPHMTQGELAAKMAAIIGHSVDQATISRIEGGDRAMSFPTFNALAQSLEIPGQCLVMLAVQDWGNDKITRSLGESLQRRIVEMYLKVFLDQFENDLADD